MKKRFMLISVIAVGLCLILSPFAGATKIVAHHQGAILANAPDYDWWYGCSPTSAGMMMGYYDINGYDGLTYDNLVPGGTAELSSYGIPGALANSVIASSGHIADFYSGGYMASGDDVTPPFHSFNSLADFMGTSQDSVSNSNGSTTFWTWNDGAKFTAQDAVDNGLMDRSGMYGITEYLDYAGYGYDVAYNQYTDNIGLTYGFTFDDYRAEIDASRVVMLHVVGHSMFGYGYDGTTNTVYLHDTWNEGQHSMTWGGAYSTLNMTGVTCFTPTGGGNPVPEPATMFLLGSCLLGLVGIRRRRNM